MSLPKVVVLCGSSKFVEIMAVCAWLIERDEGAIAMGLHLLPGWYSAEKIPHHLAEHEGVSEKMDALHMSKIDIADQVFVVNYNGYIGKSTFNEIEYARRFEKKLRWFTTDVVGMKVQGIIDMAVNRSDTMEEAFETIRQEYARTCKIALDAMNYMGDILNNQDMTLDRDVEAVTPAFDKLREVVKANYPDS